MMEQAYHFWVPDPLFADLTRAAAGAAALSLLAIAGWLALLVQRSQMPHGAALNAFAACLGSTGAAVGAGVLTRWNTAHPTLATAAFVAAACSLWSAALLLPRLRKVVRAIRGLYLSETRRRMLEDYSDELRAVNRLREKEAKDFEALASSSSDLIFRVAPDGTFEYASPAVSAFFGTARGGLGGCTFAELGLGAEAERLLGEARAKVLATGREERGFAEVRGRHFDFLCSPILEDGRIVALTLNFRDVTDRRLAELELAKAYAEMEQRVRERTEELSASRKSFEDLVNTIDGIVWESEVGKPGFSFVSSQAGRLTGYGTDRWLGEEKFWQKILHAEDLAKITGDRYVYPEQKKDRQSEYRILTADGRVRWMRDHIKVIYEGGRAVKMRGIMVDVTEQKKVEEALQAEKELSQRAASVKSEFLANMSHEIRTPLNAIVGMSSLALDCRLDDEARDCLATVKSAADSLLLLVNDILDFSKIEAGAVQLEVSDFRLLALVRSAAEVAQPLARAKGLKLETRVDPACADALSGDPGRLLQILLNLLGNAVKFTPEGGEVSLSVSGPPERLAFEVRDTGVGIEPAALEQLFQPFRQADGSTARRFGGTGLGLSICRRLAGLMNGQITVESTPGAGSVFRLEVPLRPSEGRAAADDDDMSPASTPRRRGLRVLVADDNPANQKVLLRMLEKLGHSPELAADGSEAVAAVSARPFDLVLMDCQMPGMDGYEAARRIRAHEETLGPRRRTPVVALTAHALEGEREKCKAAGMDDHLTKPISLEQLGQAVERWAARRGPTRAPVRVPARELLGPPHREEGAISLDALESLEKLNAPGKSDVVLELAGQFLSGARTQAGRIREAAARRELDELRRAAHSFKNTCHNVGARRLARVCGDLEELKDAGHSELLLRRLERETTFALTELSALVSRRKAS